MSGRQAQSRMPQSQHNQDCPVDTDAAEFQFETLSLLSQRRWMETAAAAERQSARWSLEGLAAAPGAISGHTVGALTPVCAPNRELQTERADCKSSSRSFEKQLAHPTSKSNSEWVTADTDVLQKILNEWDAEASGEAQRASHTNTNSTSMSMPYKTQTQSAAAKPPIARMVTMSSSSSSPPRKERPQVVSSSSRRKLELQMLRTHVCDLDEKLRRLKEFARLVSSTKGQQEPLTSVSTAPPLSKAVAERQCERAQQAQNDNARLKLKLLKQKKLAKDLKRALYKRIKRYAVRWHLPSSISLYASQDDSVIDTLSAVVLIAPTRHASTAASIRYRSGRVARRPRGVSGDDGSHQYHAPERRQRLLGPADPDAINNAAKRLVPQVGRTPCRCRHVCLRQRDQLRRSPLSESSSGKSDGASSRASATRQPQVQRSREFAVVCLFQLCQRAVWVQALTFVDWLYVPELWWLARYDSHPVALSLRKRSGDRHVPLSVRQPLVRGRRTLSLSVDHCHRPSRCVRSGGARSGGPGPNVDRPHRDEPRDVGHHPHPDVHDDHARGAPRAVFVSLGEGNRRKVRDPRMGPQHLRSSPEFRVRSARPRRVLLTWDWNFNIFFANARIF